LPQAVPRSTLSIYYSNLQRIINLFKPEVLLVQKIGILADKDGCRYRNETGKLEQDKKDARQLCVTLGITSADQLNSVIKNVFAAVDQQALGPVDN
jgi:hypothetical protein